MPAVIMPIDKDDPLLCGGRDSNYSIADKYSLLSIETLERGLLTWQMSTQLNLDTLDDRRGDHYTPAEDRLSKARAFNPELRLSIVPTSTNGPRQEHQLTDHGKSPSF